MLTRRDRLSNIILGLSLSWPNAPQFRVFTGNNCPMHIFDDGRPTLDLLTEEALEIVARRLIADRDFTNKLNARNRGLAAARRAAPVFQQAAE